MRSDLAKPLRGAELLTRNLELGIKSGHQRRGVTLTEPEPTATFAPMSTLTVSLPDPLAERLVREAKQRQVTQDVIVRQALEQALPQTEEAGGQSLFERLKRLAVNDPASPSDLATNPAHMEGFGVPRPS